MAENNRIGQAGEDAAALYLQQKGYTIVARNWRFGKKELDIVAQDGDKMVFVEVKTRSTLAFELPQEAVTLRKMRNLVYAADAFLQQRNIELESRFDIVTVLMGEQPRVLEHLIEAFYSNELL